MSFCGRFIGLGVTFFPFFRYTDREEGNATDNVLLTELYTLYSREIYLYLYSMCRSRETAEDLRQECFVRALLSLPDTHTNMRAWLYRVARNLLFDERRRRAPEAALTEETVPAAEADPLTLYLHSEDRRRLLRLLAELPPLRREILTLQYFSGLKQREIAALLHLSPENVRVLSLRARRELRKKLEEEEEHVFS